jgi:hypothetical protein
MCKIILHKKAFCMMLVKWTPVVNFINIKQAAFAPIFLPKKFQSQTVTREKLPKTLSYKERASKMLMKLTPADFPFEIVEMLACVSSTWNI